MIHKLSNWLVKNAKGWLILFMLGLFFLFNLVIMPSGQEWLGGTTDEVGSIDLTFGAPAELLFEKVDAYGEHGRAVYRIFALTADLAYPIVYSIFFGLAITYFFRRAFPTGSWYQRLNLVPFAAAFFDILENLGIACLLSTYPQQVTWLAYLTSAMNVVKWILAGGSVVLLLVGLTAALITSRKKK